MFITPIFDTDKLRNDFPWRKFAAKGVRIWNYWACHNLSDSELSKLGLSKVVVTQEEVADILKELNIESFPESSTRVEFEFDEQDSNLSLDGYYFPGEVRFFCSTINCNVTLKNCHFADALGIPERYPIQELGRPIESNNYAYSSIKMGNCYFRRFVLAHSHVKKLSAENCNFETCILEGCFIELAVFRKTSHTMLFSIEKCSASNFLLLESSVLGHANFNRTNFTYPPVFFNTTVHPNFHFWEVKFQDKKEVSTLSKSRIEETIASIQYLKNQMRTNGNSGLELLLGCQELETRVHRENWLNSFLLRTYSFFSDFGMSTARPFTTLLILTFSIFPLLYITIANGLFTGYQSIKLSIAYAFPFLSSSGVSLEGIWSATSPRADIDFFIQIVGSIQGFLSILLLFLAALALRNNLRIR